MIIDFTDKELYVDWIEELTDALDNPDIRYIFMKGWSGAGKSYSTVQLLVQNTLDWIRLGIFRKVGSTLKASCLQLFKDVVSSFEIKKYLEIKENKDIKSKVGEWMAMMFWMDDPEKIKSLANFDWFWVEETTELTYDDFSQLDLRLRGWKNHKIICTFNPISSKHRLKTEIQDKMENRPNAVRIEKTAWDNRFVDQNYLNTLESLKEKNLAKYNIYALNQRGEWLKWSIYPDYSIFSHDIDPDYIGLDFWFNDPCALVYLKEVDTEETKDLFVQEKLYLRELTGLKLVAEMNRLSIPKDVLIIADNARPEMITDIKDAGYTIIAVDKWKGSVNDQIDAVKTYNLHINWPNLLKEVSGYVWKLDKNGEPMDIPVDGDDHLCDATRYGVTWFKVPEFDIYIW